MLPFLSDYRLLPTLPLTTEVPLFPVCDPPALNIRITMLVLKDREFRGPVLSSAMKSGA